MAAGRQDQKKPGTTAAVQTANGTKRKTASEQPRATPSSGGHPPKSPVIGIQQNLPLENVAVTPTHIQPEQETHDEVFQKPGNESYIPTVNQQVPVKLASPPPLSPPAAVQEPPKTSSPPKEAPPSVPQPETGAFTKPPGKLPQVPPRVQSQGSINRGPPPAIPPRPQAILQRAGTVQTQSKPPLTRTTLTRQQSATSVAPQYTPQPPPKFVIPQRQNSKTSLTRQQSNTSCGSPQSPKKH